MQAELKYDVAVSFAGERRDYVERVIQGLEIKGVSVYYDKSSEIDMWGEDLAAYFDEVYRHKASKCLMFISNEYVNKAWPSHERRSALAHAIRERGYILPVRFDDTDVPGLPETIYFLDAREKSPEQIADAVIKKLGIQHKRGLTKTSFRKPKRPKSFNPYDEADKLISFLCSELKRRCESSGDDITFSAFDRDSKKCLRIVSSSEPVYSLDITRGGVGSDKGLSFYGARGEITTTGFNAWGDFEWSPEKDMVVLRFHDLSLFDMGSSTDKLFTQKEFADAIWDNVCNAIEQRQ